MAWRQIKFLKPIMQLTTTLTVWLGKVLASGIAALGRGKPLRFSHCFFALPTTANRDAGDTEQ